MYNCMKYCLWQNNTCWQYSPVFDEIAKEAEKAKTANEFKLALQYRFGMSYACLNRCLNIWNSCKQTGGCQQL